MDAERQPLRRDAVAEPGGEAGHGGAGRVDLGRGVVEVDVAAVALGQARAGRPARTAAGCSRRRRGSRRPGAGPPAPGRRAGRPGRGSRGGGSWRATRRCGGRRCGRAGPGSWWAPRVRSDPGPPGMAGGLGVAWARCRTGMGLPMDRTYLRSRRRPLRERRPSGRGVAGGEGQAGGVSQWASSQATSAARASLRRPKGPSTGPPTGRRSAVQRPSASGSTWLARAMRRAAERGEVDRLAVDRPHRAVRGDDQVHHASPGAVACRRMRRRGRSTSIPSSADCTCASCVATRWRRPWLSRRSCGATPRTARCARSTSSSSCSFERTFSSRNRAKNSDEVVHGRVAEDLRLAVLAHAA